MKRLMTLAFCSVLLPIMAVAQAAIMYKSPYCGCCLGHAAYLEELGYEIKVIDTEADVLAAFKDEHGIPAAEQGCHTLMVEGYVVEGHVPVEAIEKLLAERPDIVGITLPGMPAGSPGMGGEKTEAFKVLVIEV